MTDSPTTRTVKLSTVALPAEHGGWGFLFEPIVLGLLLAPTGWGALLALGVVAAFLTHQPLKLTLKDRQNGVRLPRTVWAERFLLIYGGVALLSLGIVTLFAPRLFWLPLLLAAPLALIQVLYDARGQSRAAVPEIAGASALAAVAPALVLIDEQSLWLALAVWLALLTRIWPSIEYVRVKLRQVKGKTPDLRPFWALQLGVIAVAALATTFGAWPWSVLAANSVLLLRSFLSLHIFTQPIKAMWVGIQELVLGLLFVLLTALGYLLSAG